MFSILRCIGNGSVAQLRPRGVGAQQGLQALWSQGGQPPQVYAGCSLNIVFLTEILNSGSIYVCTGLSRCPEELYSIINLSKPDKLYACSSNICLSQRF